MLERFKEQVSKFETSFDNQWVFQRQVSDFFGTYEDTNLRFYAGTQLENFMIFKHPHKFEAKTCIEDLVIIKSSTNSPILALKRAKPF